MYRVSKKEPGKSYFIIFVKHINKLEETNIQNVKDIFGKIQEVIESDYTQKNDMIRCHLHLLVHEAMKAQASSQYIPNKNAGQRIAELFLALTDFANRLSVHVNHLNRVVKTVTGRTTSALINNRIIQEAVQLLQRSNFIKKHTGVSPSGHRLMQTA
ncbi:MAG: hypothetical protein LUH15_02795 [Tannerellaceae bacterium]|nr:hypothetical protein [Tannerellaceae bacterium]